MLTRPSALVRACLRVIGQPCTRGGGVGVRKGKQKKHAQVQASVVVCERQTEPVCVRASGGRGVPVAVDSGHTAVNSARHRRRKMKRKTLSWETEGFHYLS